MSYIKDVDLPRHAWDTPPFLLIVSPTPPVQSVDTYVRSVSHVTTKRKEVDQNLWVWGSVPRALRARGSPAKNRAPGAVSARRQQHWCQILENMKLSRWRRYSQFYPPFRMNKSSRARQRRTVFGDRVLLCEQSWLIISCTESLFTWQNYA